jgi:hypothetical protein
VADDVIDELRADQHVVALAPVDGHGCGRRGHEQERQHAGERPQSQHPGQYGGASDRTARVSFALRPSATSVEPGVSPSSDRTTAIGIAAPGRAPSRA